MPQKYITVYPAISQELLTNPGIGFIAAPQLMGEPGKITDNNGKEVEKYKFTPDSKTYNHPDSKVVFCAIRWNEIEAQKGIYDWSILEEKLNNAKKLGCTAIVRCSPYALSDSEDVPQWFRKEYPDEPDFPFWRVNPVTTPYVTYWSDFIKEFAKHFDGNPIISSVDMAIVGAWGEGGGTELLSEQAMKAIIGAYIDGFQITPLQALLHDPKSLKIITERKAKIGFRVDCLGDMGGFHGTEWSHMLDFYPENIQNFGMSDAWQAAPVVFEACWYMNDWYRQGWDIDYIVEESLKWHISSYNSKATIVPEPWRKSIENWIGKMGYRFELRKLSFPASVKAGESLNMSALWANVGVAPIYIDYPLIVRLIGNDTVYRFTSKEDIRKWLPDMDILWEERFQISPDIQKGEYTLEIGIETPLKEIGNIQLAIKGQKDGYYPMGKLIIV
jgi:hypothetical protein